MIIEDQLTVRIPDRFRVNNAELIYLADIEVELIKITRKNGHNISKKTRIVKLEDQLYSANENKETIQYFNEQLVKKCDKSDNETMEIIKVILTKELSYRSYE